MGPPILSSDHYVVYLRPIIIYVSKLKSKQDEKDEQKVFECRYWIPVNAGSLKDSIMLELTDFAQLFNQRKFKSI